MKGQPIIVRGLDLSVDMSSIEEREKREKDEIGDRMK